jgi:multidrug resistance efflux pump
MIVVLLNTYIAILALFVWLKFIPFNTFWKLSPVIVAIALLVGLFIPMGWGAPSGAAVVVRNSIQIVPSVAGEVVDVPVMANTPIKQGDVLFRIDPAPYQATVKAIDAQLKLAERRLGEMTQLLKSSAGRPFDVEQREAETDQLKAQLDGAQWNLDKTVVRAPADGYVTNLALRKGARVTAQSPVMAFIDTSETILGVEIPQVYARYVAVGQPVEITFKTFPGEVFSGRVETVLQAIASGQTQVGGLAVAPTEIQSAPFVARIKLDDQDVARGLPAGSTGLAAIFTDHVTAADWKFQVTTPNASTNYIYFNFNLKNGPVVIEIPAAVYAGLLGSMVDAWDEPMADIGPAGEDEGRGGKYLLLPPDFKGETPPGYFALRYPTYNGYALYRAIRNGTSDADAAAALALVKKLRVYPLAQAANPPEQRFIDIYGKTFDGIAKFDESFFESLNRMAQEESVQPRDMIMMRMLKRDCGGTTITHFR